MKKLAVLPALALAWAVTGVASAAVFYEPFNYPTNAPLGGNTNATAPASTNGFDNTNVWTKSGSATTDPTVVSGNLTYPGLPTSQGASAELTGAGGGSVTADRIATQDFKAGDTIYFSMIVQVPSTVTNFGAANGGSFFTGFEYTPDSLTGTNTFNTGTQSSASPLVVHQATDAKGYNLGIAYRDTATRQFGTQEFAAGQTVFLVGKYFIGPGNQDDVASLFFNPDLSTGLEPATPDVISANTVGSSGPNDFFFSGTGGTGTQLETTLRSFILRSNTSEPANMLVDEVRIGTSYADVTGAAVPEPASLGLLALAGLGLVGRRRRA